MAPIPSFCLMKCGSRPLAVAVENVGQGLELDGLVSLSLCPPQIAGLCPYHSQVLPVATLEGERAAGLPGPPTAEPRGSLRERPCWRAIGAGNLGPRIDPGGTVIATARPSRHEPVKGSRRGRDGRADPPRGNRPCPARRRGDLAGLRDLVVNWYLQIRESAATANRDPAGV